jgi:hypothetical protein
MVRAARSGDSLVERVDQLADVYGEVLLGLYDELTDQRERTEAVASRADAVLGEARRLMEDMSSVATEAKAIEQQASAAAAAAVTPIAPGEAAGSDAEQRAREALARLGTLEAAAASLERSVQERTEAAVSRCESLTAGLSSDLRNHVAQSLADMRTEVQTTVAELRQHVRDLVDAMAREAHETARRTAGGAGGDAPAGPIPDTSAIIEAVRREASATIADQVRRQAADSVAEELQRQRQSTPLAPAAVMPAAIGDAEGGGIPYAQLVAQLQSEIEARTSNFGVAAERAQELSRRLDDIVGEAQTHLQDAKSDRAAAAFALRESRAELDAAKRALDMSDYTFTLDRMRRTEMWLYGTAALAVVAILLSLWAILS